MQVGVTHVAATIPNIPKICLKLRPLLASSSTGKLHAEPEFHEEQGDYFQLGISGGPTRVMRSTRPTHVFPPNSSSLRVATDAEVASVQHTGSSTNCGCFAWVNEKCDLDLPAFAKCLVYMVALFGEGRNAEQLVSPDQVTCSPHACYPPVELPSRANLTFTTDGR
jgi:hypothetical protein